MATSPKRTLWLVATPLGNLGDLSPRAEQVLRDADLWFVEDTRVSAKLAHHLQVKKPMQVVNDHTPVGKLEMLADTFPSSAALLTDAGTPVVSDPGTLFIQACLDEGIEVDSVPGPSAATNALALSGFFGQRFAFLGFLGRKAGDIKKELAPFAESPFTLVLFESPFRVEALLRCAHEVLGERRFAVCREMTKLHQEVIRGWLSEGLEGRTVLKGEITVVIEGRRKKEMQRLRDNGNQD